MALLQTIRNKFGIVIIIAVGIGLLLFIVNWDQLFNTINRYGATTIAKIDGESIDINEFQQYEKIHMTFMENAYQNQRSITAEEQEQMRQQAWQDVLNQHLYFKQIEKAGITVSDAEMEDLLYGTNIHYVIKQNFTNPQTGIFDTTYAKQFFARVESMPANSREAIFANYWKKIIKEDRLMTKYRNMISKGFYTPTELAKREYQERNTNVNFVLLSKHYSLMPDDSIKVSDAEIEKYYKEHGHKYQQDKESREVEYVLFPIFPSYADTMFVKAEIDSLYRDFNTLTEGFLEFAKSNSDERKVSAFISEKDMPNGLPEGFFNSPEGTISEVILNKNTFFFTKILKAEVRPDSVQLSAIVLLPNDTTTYEQIKHKGDSIVKLAQKGENFFMLVYMNSNDEQSKQKGGDLGWIQDNQMVPEDLRDFAFKGNINDVKLIEQGNGANKYVVIFKITNQIEKSRKVELATIVKNINYSEETNNKIYGNANNFVDKCSNGEAFDSVVIAQNIVKRVASVGALDNKIANIDNAREMVKWIYSDAVKKGSVSDVYSSGDRFIILKVNSIKPKGTMLLEDVSNRIRSEIVKDKKAEIYIKTMKNDLANISDLSQLNTKENYRYDTISNLNFGTFSIPGYGTEPKLNGVFSTIPENKISEPIKGNNGVYVLKVISKTSAPEKEDYSSDKLSSMQNLSNQIYKLNPAIEKVVKIEDKRIKFY